MNIFNREGKILDVFVTAIVLTALFLMILDISGDVKKQFRWEESVISSTIYQTGELKEIKYDVQQETSSSLIMAGKVVVPVNNITNVKYYHYKFIEENKEIVLKSKEGEIKIYDDLEHGQKPFVSYKHLKENKSNPENEYTIVHKGYYNITIHIPIGYKMQSIK